MAQSMKAAFQQATKQRQEGEFDRAAGQLASRMGPVSKDDLQVSPETAANPRLQALNQVAKKHAKRQVN